MALGKHSRSPTAAEHPTSVTRQSCGCCACSLTGTVATQATSASPNHWLFFFSAALHPADGTALVSTLLLSQHQQPAPPQQQKPPPAAWADGPPYSICLGNVPAGTPFEEVAALFRGAYVSIRIIGVGSRQCLSICWVLTSNMSVTAYP